MKAKILIVEDQFIEANSLRLILKKAGYHIFPIAHSVDDALQILEVQKPDIVMLDIRLQGALTGIDLARALKNMNIPFVYLSANSDKQVLDAAIATKPYGFLVKPFREKDVLVMLDVARYRHQHEREFASPEIDRKVAIPLRIPAEELPTVIGQSPVFLEVLKNTSIVGPSDTSVLILGESGTGKELIAQMTHCFSSRRKKPLVVVNCATLPANLIEAELFGHEKGAFTGALDKKIGKFEQADGGTVFLDEIGELSTDLQVKFLRVLQEREIEPVGGRKRKIDVRVIAATNRKLEDEVAAGRFRIDLYYRLNVFPIYLPALRERKEDIPLLARHFLHKFSSKLNKTVTGLSDQAVKEMIAYQWPGNVRELENVLERSVLLATGPIITTLQMSGNTGKRLSADSSGRLKTMTENERDHIVAALEKCSWRVHGSGGAAEILDINASTLYSRMKKLGLLKKVASKT
jgi:two-component system, NtrC family, response regulator HydG